MAQLVDGGSAITDIPNITGGTVLRSGVTVAIVRAVVMAISFTNMFILMKLLSPADFGTVDMVATLIAFLSVGSNLGLSAATVQSREVNHAQLSTLFWFNSAFGLFMFLLSIAAGPVLAWFYKEPALSYVVALMGMSFFWGGLSAQSYALLQRDMRFVRRGIAAISGQAAGMCVAVFMAWSGYRYWSIACGSLTVSVVGSIMAIALAGFWPGLPKRGTGVRAKLRYGGWIVGFNFLNYFSRNLDNVIIGKFCGKEELGYYARAYKLYLLPLTFINSIVRQVMFPVLSRMQDDKKRFAETYAGLLGILIVTTSTLAAWMGIMAEEIMSLFGPQWMPAVPVFRILALVGVIQPIMNISGVAYLATGNSRIMFWWSMYATPIIGASFLVGVRWGIVGVAWSYASVIFVLVVGPLIWLVLRVIGANIALTIKNLLLPFVLLLASSVAVWIARQLTVFLDVGFLIRAVVALMVGLFVHAILVWLLYRLKIRTLLADINNVTGSMEADNVLSKAGTTSHEGA